MASKDEEEARRLQERLMAFASGGGLAGVVASLALWRKRSLYGTSAIPRLIVGSASSGACYSVMREVTRDAHPNYTPVQVGGLSGMLSGLLLAMFLGPAPTISMTLGGIGAAAGATAEHSRQAVLDWRRQQMLSRHGVGANSTNATAPEALANEAVKENKGEEEQGEGSRQELPTWLPLRSLDSKERLKTKQGRAALLAREVEELEVEVAQQRAELSRRGITPPASREA